MFRADKLATLIEASKYSKKDICKKVEISVQALDNTLKGAEIGSRKLERIADLFRVPMDYFYDREVEIDERWHIGHSVNGNGNKVVGDIPLSEYRREIEHLKQLLKEKERTIQILLEGRNK